ncbi:MAG: type VI secretion system ImpA family N-terminal domain-containing protein, partial [Candidatus Bathyarchaeota archaeon]|nr:type VI secretion system ImpA family N-terminal domain-containing protein [Candidatus Bathyarchaeota archaeon]
MNLENLLQPIPGDHPCGKDPRRSMIFDEISRLRKPGELEELDREDWTKIRDLSLEVLTSQSKDLQLSVWLLEALGRLEGIDGLRDGLELTKNLIETFWKDVFPEIDEEDEEPLYRRTAVVESLNLIIPDIVKIEPLTLSGEGYSMLHYEVTQMTGEKKEALLNDGWPSSARFDEEMMRASLDHWKGMEEKCSALVEELAHLEEVTDKFFSAVDSDKSSSGSLESTVSFLKSKEVLEEFLYLVKRNARKKAELEPPVEQPVHETP